MSDERQNLEVGRVEFDDPHGRRAPSRSQVKRLAAQGAPVDVAASLLRDALKRAEDNALDIRMRVCGSLNWAFTPDDPLSFSVIESGLAELIAQRESALSALSAAAGREARLREALQRLWDRHHKVDEGGADVCPECGARRRLKDMNEPMPCAPDCPFAALSTQEGGEQ